MAFKAYCFHWNHEQKVKPVFYTAILQGFATTIWITWQRRLWGWEGQDPGMHVAKLCRKDVHRDRAQPPPRAWNGTKHTAESCLISDLQPLNQRTKAQGYSNDLQSDLPQIFWTTLESYCKGFREEKKNPNYTEEPGLNIACIMV